VERGTGDGSGCCWTLLKAGWRVCLPLDLRHILQEEVEVTCSRTVHGGVADRRKHLAGSGWVEWTEWTEAFLGGGID